MMGRTLSELKRYGANWHSKRRKALRRDDYTCQRCGHKSGPHAGDEGRVLQAHHVEKISDGGSNDVSNLRTLCRPCHGVQHPDNEVFDGDRPWARMYPSRGADRSVAHVNSGRERESLEEFLERKNPGYCQRCGNPSEESELYIYPNIDFDDRGQYTNPAEKFGALCGPCAGLVFESDDDEHIEHRMYRTDGSKVGRQIDRLKELRERAQIVGSKTTRKFGTTRNPVNSKEWLLFKSPYRFVHATWRKLGTAFSTAVVFVLLGPLLDRTIGTVDTSVSGIGPTSAWFLVVGGGLLVSLSLALVFRWSAAALSDWIWDRLGDSIEPHHFRKRKGFTLRRRLKCAWTLLGIPYGLLGGILLLLLLW